mmetsp:Transcript_33269/g.82387  ORF Transcript_33269/g.82387 Transcript_33269/m.82387 type:complete len:205 (-) Transcript_33269:3805-4419(-)
MPSIHPPIISIIMNYTYMHAYLQHTHKGTQSTPPSHPVSLGHAQRPLRRAPRACTLPPPVLIDTVCRHIGLSPTLSDRRPHIVFPQAHEGENGRLMFTLRGTGHAAESAQGPVVGEVPAAQGVSLPVDALVEDKPVHLGVRQLLGRQQSAFPSGACSNDHAVEIGCVARRCERLRVLTPGIERVVAKRGALALPGLSSPSPWGG